MNRSLTAGLMLISVLLTFSLGTVFAEVSKDKINTISTMNITRDNTTSLNTTNETVSQNVTENVTNPFAHERGNIHDYCAPGCYWNESRICTCG